MEKLTYGSRYHTDANLTRFRILWNILFKMLCSCCMEKCYTSFVQDPDAKKPEDWDDREKIDDPDDKKPEDYDKPEHIVDPDAKKPEDWDDEMDGEWEPPMIDNPEYKVCTMHHHACSIVMHSVALSNNCALTRGLRSTQ